MAWPHDPHVRNPTSACSHSCHVGLLGVSRTWHSPPQGLHDTCFLCLSHSSLSLLGSHLTFSTVPAQSLQTCPCLLTLLLPSLALWPCSRVCFSLRPLASFSRLYAFTCSGGRNKLLRDTEIYSLTALEARSPPSRCGQG